LSLCGQVDAIVEASAEPSVLRGIETTPRYTYSILSIFAFYYNLMEGFEK